MATLTQLDGKPVLWEDALGVFHAAEGCYVSPPRDLTLLLWTRCGQHDIPANTAFHPNVSDAVTCPYCQT